MCPSTTVALGLKELAIQLFGAQANPRGRPRQCVCEGIGNDVRNRQYLGAHPSRDAEMWDAEVVVVWYRTVLRSLTFSPLLASTRCSSGVLKDRSLC